VEGLVREPAADLAPSDEVIFKPPLFIMYGESRMEYTKGVTMTSVPEAKQTATQSASGKSPRSVSREASCSSSTHAGFSATCLAVDRAVIFIAPVVIFH
jgi:hypothetical protein